MNVIDMYSMLDETQELIFYFNWKYQLQDVKVCADMIPTQIEQIYKMGISSVSYWRDTNIDFQILYNWLKDIESALIAEDYVYIYDVLNYNIKYFVIDMLKLLFQRNAAELKNWFWKENCEVLKKCNPKLLELLEEIDENEANEFTRSYGLRGRVVYRKSGDREFDLYSSYNPCEVGLQIAQRANWVKYSKIYVWGCNGGYEIGGRCYISQYKIADINVYITDLKEFKCLLSNTLRKGIFLNPNVCWNFNVGIETFLKNIEIEKSDDTYIYITDCFDDEFYKLNKFIKEHCIDSNIGSVKCTKGRCS